MSDALETLRRRAVRASQVSLDALRDYAIGRIEQHRHELSRGIPSQLIQDSATPVQQAGAWMPKRNLGQPVIPFKHRAQKVIDLCNCKGASRSDIVRTMAGAAQCSVSSSYRIIRKLVEARRLRRDTRGSQRPSDWLYFDNTSHA
jgi:hypothetical protein